MSVRDRSPAPINTLYVAWAPIAVTSLPLSDDDSDREADLPATLSGPILIRVIDTTRFQGLLLFNTVFIDELFVRSVP